MWIERKALAQEVPAVAGLETRQLCEALAALGFPVDGVALREGAEVIDVDITANRGDAMSHRGLARELAAQLRQPLAGIAVAAVEEGAPVVEVRLESRDCPIYSTAVLDLGSGTTPLHAQAFLLALEASPKRLPAVDASNELLHRYGHPTHAFDADRIQGAVTVRKAKAGETLVTLDGVTRTLAAEDLVIADATGPIALAGVMGGEATKVTEGTRRVLLESAWFEAKGVRATARRHSLHTDASHRYGRGADPAMATVARDLLVGRLQAWCGARLVGAWTAGAAPVQRTSLTLSETLLIRVAGEPVSLAEAAEALRWLGCEVEAGHDQLRVVPPSWRHDLAIPEDLAEEVLRLRGYERIPSVLPPMEGPPEPLSPAYLQRQRLSRRLAHLGFHQTVTYGFVSPEMDQQACGPRGPEAFDMPEERVLSNPLGLEYSVLRRSLVPSLVEAAKRNLKQGQREVRLFEIAPTFRGTPEGPKESWTIALVWGGESWNADPESKAVLVKAKHLHGILKDILRPGTAQSVQPVEGDTLLTAEFLLDQVQSADERIIPTYTPQSRFPAVERDLSVTVPTGLTWQAMDLAIQASLKDSALTELTCADLYQGKNLPVGAKSWLMRLTFRAMDRTLVGAEVDGWVVAALTAAEVLGAKLRV
jgi:phenylalanyl-tRNA synthetase beta chain